MNQAGFTRSLRFVSSLTVFSAAFFCVTSSPRAADTPDQPQERVTATDTYKVKVNLIVIPVVVRDASGHTVGNLRKEDFQVFDNRKPQEITDFFVEKTEPPETAAAAGTGATPAPGGFQKFLVPDRFTALVFDDVHSNFDNLPQLQAASQKLISTSLARSERLGIFTTSGKLAVEFTDNREKLLEGLRHLRPNPLPGSRPPTCPALSHADANRIVRRHDAGARDAAVGEVMQCGVRDPRMAEEMVNDTAEQVLRIGDIQTSMVLNTISTLLDRLAALPGQRTIVLASPSFVISDGEHKEYQIVDRAVHSHVLINTLDTQGLYAGDEESANSDVLKEFAYGTGGSFVRNTNDLTEGLRRVAAPPEYTYQLGISPQNIREDGKFHHLKVQLTNGSNLSVSAREGYFAPNASGDPVLAEKNQLTDTVFSQSEIHDLPVEMRTQFIQDDKPLAKLSVTAVIDVRGLPRREDRPEGSNELRLIAAIFDRNGKYMGALQRKVAVHWSEGQPETPAAATFSFLLNSGGYLVRLVVRDSESQHLYAQNSLVEIPNKVASKR
jgi:VWFA-related protein